MGLGRGLRIRKGSPTPPDPSRPRVALVTEGTYPCAGGGVAVWCDQLMRNLPGVDFDVVALTLTDREPRIWERPPNVVSLRQHGVWDRVRDRVGRPTGEPLPDPLRRLVHHLVDPPPTDLRRRDGGLSAELDRFATVLEPVLAMAVDGTLERHLRFESFQAPVLEAVNASEHLRSRYQVTLADTLAVATALPHLLRPLTIDPGPVDVVHATANGLPALVGMAAVARRGTPLVVTEHGLYLRERYLAAGTELPRPVVKDVVLRLHRLVAASVFRWATLVTPVSTFNRRWQLALGARPESVRTLRNGVDPADFPLRTADVDRPDVVWLGRIDPVKDLHTLIRAAALVRAAVPDVRFRLFGAEPAGVRGYLDSCRALAEELDLVGTIRFEGKVDHPVEAFHQGQFSILSSITEGFPYSVLESMSCGVPVVGTAVGGVPEAIAHTGLVVPPRDPATMANACIQLLKWDDHRRAMSIAARRRVEQLFALEQMVEGHDVLYRDLAEQHRRVVDLRAAAGSDATPTVPA